MRQAILLIFILVITVEPISASLEEFHFQPLRRRLIFVEDYYKLYRLNLYGDTAAHLANINYMTMALKAAESNRWWAHPTKSFAYVSYDWANPPRHNKSYYPFRNYDPPYTEAHHAKYKELMKMRICLLLMRSYLKLGSRYESENIYWFHSEDYEDLPYIKRKNKEHYAKRGFRIARKAYKAAQLYWERTKHYVRISWEEKYKHEENPGGVLFREIDLQGVEMDQMESEVYKIYFGGNLRHEPTVSQQVPDEKTGELKPIQIKSTDPKYLKRVKRFKNEEMKYFNKETIRNTTL
ncbi:MAG: hypothetical protein OEZ36_10490, partial [Spirochaetota bacterium]|nr:hypothetical protein [Spirochaetota bacterium]